MTDSDDRVVPTIKRHNCSCATRSVNRREPEAVRAQAFVSEDQEQEYARRRALSPQAHTCGVGADKAMRMGLAQIFYRVNAPKIYRGA